MNKIKISVITIMVVLLCSLIGIAGEESATIRITGADAMVPLITKMAAEYAKSNPNIKIEVTGGGAGKGAKDALAGTVELGMVSREIDAEESQRGSYVPVAKDAVFITASAQNPVAKKLAEKGITKKALKQIFLAGKAATWGEIAGTEDKTPVKAFTREDACGAGETYAKFIGGAQPDLQGTTVKGDKGMAEAIKKEASAIGYNNLAAAYDLSKGSMSDGLIVIPIDVNDNGKVDTGEDISSKDNAFKAIASGVYPAPPARTLYLITKGKFSGASKNFVQWILKDGQKIAGTAGFIPLEAAVAEGALKKME